MARHNRKQNIRSEQISILIPGSPLGIFDSVHQYCCCHDHLLPRLHQKVRFFFFTEVVTCWAYRYYPILLPVLRRYYPVLLVFLRRYYQLKADTSSAQSFTLLKNFFTYVDDLEYHVFNKRIEKVFSTILTLIYSQ